MDAGLLALSEMLVQEKRNLQAAAAHRLTIGGLSCWFQTLYADLGNGGVKIFHEGDVGAQVLQHIVDGIFKA